MTLGQAPHRHAQETQRECWNLNEQSLAMGQPFSSVGGWDGGELVEAKTRDPNRCETPFPSHSVLLQQQQEVSLA